MSVSFLFDDEHCTYNLMSRRNVQQHWFADVWRGQDWVACQKGLYFLQSGHCRVRPLEVVGASEEAVEWQGLFSQSGDKAA